MLYLENCYVLLIVDFPTLHRTAHCVERGNLQRRKKYKAIISSRVLGEINLTQSVNSKKRKPRTKKEKIQLKTLLSVRANVLQHRSEIPSRGVIKTFSLQGARIVFESAKAHIIQRFEAFNFNLKSLDKEQRSILMSKKSLQRLTFWLSLLTVFGLVFSACGSQPPATPAPTVIPLPTMSKQENSFTFGDFVLAGVSLDNLKGVMDDTDTILTFDQQGRRYSVVTNIVTPPVSTGDWNVSWTLNQVDAKGRKLSEIDECYSADTNRKHLVRDVYNSIGVHSTSMQYSAFCLLPNNGVLYMWFTLDVMDEAYNKFLTPIGTITMGTGSTAVPFTATTTITASPTSTLNPNVPTATSTLVLPAYVTGTPDAYGVITEGTRTIGVDSSDPQVSIMFWEFGKKGTLYSSSSTKVLVALDNDPATPLTALTPVAAHNKCWFFNDQLYNEYFDPCYKYTIAANTVSVSAPGMYSEDLYYHGNVDGGPEVYMPKTPTVTPSVTPSATVTATARPTQDLTLGTPVATDSLVDDCGGKNQSASYMVDVNPKSSACVENITDQPTGSAKFVVGTKTYIITLSINANKLFATYILGGSFPENTSCVLNGTSFAKGKSNWVQLTTGNLNSRVECTLPDETTIFTGIASAK